MRALEALLLGVVLLVLVAVALPAMGNPGKFASAVKYLQTGQTNQTIQAAPAASGTSVVGGPSISADFIDRLLCKYGSPACNTGGSLYSLGQQSNIDPAFALAVFWNESGFGRSGMATETLSLGNLRCIDGAACMNGYAAFSSWQDGYAAFYRLVAGSYYAGAGLTTPETILPKYAPVGDGNSPSHYISVVENCMSMWRSGVVGVP